MDRQARETLVVALIAALAPKAFGKPEELVDDILEMVELLEVGLDKLEAKMRARDPRPPLEMPPRIPNY